MSEIGIPPLSQEEVLDWARRALVPIAAHDAGDDGRCLIKDISVPAVTLLRLCLDLAERLQDDEQDQPFVMLKDLANDVADGPPFTSDPFRIRPMKPDGG